MSIDNHDFFYYIKCMMGGALACGLTHTSLIPFDKREEFQLRHSPSGFIKLANEGYLFFGWFPKFVGTSLMGFSRFGFYEIFKDVYKGIIGEENGQKYRRVGWLVASGCSEVIAQVLNCPFETIWIKMLYSLPNSHDHSGQFIPAYKQLTAINGTKALYYNLPYVWTRPIPQTILKFVGFEQIVEHFYTKIFIRPRNEYSKGQQLSITFASGFLAGVFCQTIYHPAETILSKWHAEEYKGRGVYYIYSKIGFQGLWAGLTTRIKFISYLTSLQWLIYDIFKISVGFQTSGGSGNSLAVNKY